MQSPKIARRNIRRLLTFAAAAAVSGLAGTRRASAGYQFTTLDDPLGTVATQINGISGSIVVGSYIDSSDVTHGFFYDTSNPGGGFHTVDDNNFPSTTASSLVGVAGTSTLLGSFTHGGVTEAFLADTSHFSGGTTFPHFSDPAASNTTNAMGTDGSTYVGNYIDSSGVQHGFTDHSGTFTPVDIAGASSTSVNGIAGNVFVGTSVGGDGHSHGFLNNAGSLTTLDYPGATDTYALSLEGSNIVGEFSNGPGLYKSGMIYNGSSYTEINDPAAVGFSAATGISGSNVVGWYADNNGIIHGFLATPSKYFTITATTTPVPGTVTVTFTTTSAPAMHITATASVNNATVTASYATTTFTGTTSDGRKGIYANFNGQLLTLADTTTPFPGGGGSLFSAFKNPLVSTDSLGKATTAFLGTGTGGASIIAMYDISATKPNGDGQVVLAGPGTAVPGGTLTAVSSPFLSGSHVVFAGSAGATSGIYEGGVTSSGASAINPLITTLTSIPGGIGTFSGLFNPAVDSTGTNVVVLGTGSSGQMGVYQMKGMNLSVFADTHTAIPAHMAGPVAQPAFASFFTSFSAVALSGSNVAFIGSGAAVQGVYKDQAGGLISVADTTTAIPGGTGNFTSFPGSLAMDGNSVAFIGLGSSGQEGIYTDDGGTLTDVVDLNSDLEAGKTIASLSLSSSGFSGDPMIAFQATFTDGTEGIYSAPSPEPTSLGTIALAGAGLLARRRRKAARAVTDS